MSWISGFTINIDQVTAIVPNLRNIQADTLRQHLTVAKQDVEEAIKAQVISALRESQNGIDDDMLEDNGAGLLDCVLPAAYGLIRNMIAYRCAMRVYIDRFDDSGERKLYDAYSHEYNTIRLDGLIRNIDTDEDSKIDNEALSIQDRLDRRQR